MTIATTKCKNSATDNTVPIFNSQTFCPECKSQRMHACTIRHWHATMEFHKTKNLLHVQQRLGHKNIRNTLIYTHLISFEGDEYHSATAETVEETCKLVDAGFEYVCELNGVQIFRKRK